MKNTGILLCFSIIVYHFGIRKLYRKSVEKQEPVFWQGALQYRLNFRDVATSLNQCLGRTQFVPNLMFRSNKYFSGWDCKKINNPTKIYSLNYSPEYKQQFYCLKGKKEKQFGIKFNDDFWITDISTLSMWNSTGYRNTMCSYFTNALNDLAKQDSFLFHCDVGRDRTGDFAAMLTYMLLEDRQMNNEEMIEALECDYEKTSALKKNQVGHIKNFLIEMEKQNGIKNFIQSQCDISDDIIAQASKNFIL